MDFYSISSQIPPLSYYLKFKLKAVMGLKLFNFTFTIYIIESLDFMLEMAKEYCLTSILQESHFYHNNLFLVAKVKFLVKFME